MRLRQSPRPDCAKRVSYRLLTCKYPGSTSFSQRAFFCATRPGTRRVAAESGHQTDHWGFAPNTKRIAAGMQEDWRLPLPVRPFQVEQNNTDSSLSQDDTYQRSERSRRMWGKAAREAGRIA